MNLSDWLTLVGMLGAMMVSIMTGVWWMSAMLNKRFSSIYDKIDGSLDKIIAKLEYHEKHDDDRFGRLANALWEIRLQAAMNRSDSHNRKSDSDNRLDALREIPTT